MHYQSVNPCRVLSSPSFSLSSSLSSSLVFFSSLSVSLCLCLRVVLLSCGVLCCLVVCCVVLCCVVVCCVVLCVLCCVVVCVITFSCLVMGSLLALSTSHSLLLSLFMYGLRRCTASSESETSSMKFLRGLRERR